MQTRRFAQYKARQNRKTGTLQGSLNWQRYIARETPEQRTARLEKMRRYYRMKKDGPIFDGQQQQMDHFEAHVEQSTARFPDQSCDRNPQIPSTSKFQQQTSPNKPVKKFNQNEIIVEHDSEWNDLEMARMVFVSTTTRSGRQCTLNTRYLD